MVLRTEILVVKRDGTREEFNPEKLAAGVRKACWKRPVSEDQVGGLVKTVSERLENLQEKEVSTQVIGELIMEELQRLDEVAYVRFASVYRRFKDIDQFINEIRHLTERQR
jgi:transcriptional repressor NrdR